MGVLAAKIPLFRISGILVQVHIAFIFFFLFSLYEGWDYKGFTALFLVLQFGSVFLHELGHCWGARRQGGEAHEVLLWPLGGLAYLEAPMTPWAQGFVAAAGPAVNLVLAAAGGLFWFALPPHWQYWDRLYDAFGFHPVWLAELLVTVNIGLFAFNMLPAFPMDMGRIFQAVLWVWMGFQRSMRIAVYTSFVCCGGLVLTWIIGQATAKGYVPFAIGQTMTLFIAVFVFQSAFNQLQLLNAGAYEDLDEPWRQTFRYHPQEEARPRQPGFIARWREKRQAEQERAVAVAEQERAQRLDEVLRRVAQVGMDGLTPGEKDFLAQESERLRGKR